MPIRTFEYHSYYDTPDPPINHLSGATRIHVAIAPAASVLLQVVVEPANCKVTPVPPAIVIVAVLPLMMLIAAPFA